MLKNKFSNIQEKSLTERFLLVIGILIFVGYFVLGMAIIFWNYITVIPFPFSVESNYRIALGILLIVYSFLRFLRYFKTNSE